MVKKQLSQKMATLKGQMDIVSDILYSNRNHRVVIALKSQGLMLPFHDWVQ